MKRLLISLVLPLLLSFGLFGQSNPPLSDDAPLDSIPESDDLRQRYWSDLIAPGLLSARQAETRQATNRWGEWQLSRLRQNGGIYTIISPKKHDGWPVYAQGTWIFRRSADTGNWEQVKIYMRSNQDLYIKLYPAGERTYMDVLAYGAVLHYQVALPLTFEQVALLPLRRILRLTEETVDWSVYFGDTALYADMRLLVDRIRERLPELRYRDDGALDQDGRAVFIADGSLQDGAAGLNCSGFLKWLTDGMLYPVTGTWLGVNELKERMLAFRGSGFTEAWEELFDPYFGLDWCRALSGAAWSALYRRRNSSPLDFDVNEPGFALLHGRSQSVLGTQPYQPFPAVQPGTGIHISGLKPYLYLLAIKEPGTMYFAQFNARDTTDIVLRRYFHVAALLPYFDEAGLFQVAVFESAAETSLDAVLGNPRYEFVNLVRMPILKTFQPPLLP